MFLDRWNLLDVRRPQQPSKPSSYTVVLPRTLESTFSISPSRSWIERNEDSDEILDERSLSLEDTNFEFTANMMADVHFERLQLNVFRVSYV